MSLFNAIMCILTLTMVSSQTFAQQHTLEDLFPTDRVLQIDITLDEDDWDEIRNQTRGFAEAFMVVIVSRRRRSQSSWRSM